MSCGPKLHETRMGHRFFEGTMPRLVEQLERLNNLLEKQLQTNGDAPDDQTGKEPSGGQ
jgi:hypothetical protein